MSELVKKIYKLAKKTDHSPTFMMAQYSIQFELLEKQHESCYGVVSSIKTKQPDYCMNCIGQMAYKNLEEYYEKKQV